MRGLFPVSGKNNRADPQMHLATAILGGPMLEPHLFLLQILQGENAA